MGHELSHITTTYYNFHNIFRGRAAQKGSHCKKIEKYLVKQNDCHTDDTSAFFSKKML